MTYAVRYLWVPLLIGTLSGCGFLLKHDNGNNNSPSSNSGALMWSNLNCSTAAVGVPYNGKTCVFGQLNSADNLANLSAHLVSTECGFIQDVQWVQNHIEIVSTVDVSMPQSVTNGAQTTTNSCALNLTISDSIGNSVPVVATVPVVPATMVRRISDDSNVTQIATNAYSFIVTAGSNQNSSTFIPAAGEYWILSNNATLTLYASVKINLSGLEMTGSSQITPWLCLDPSANTNGIDPCGKVDFEVAGDIFIDFSSSITAEGSGYAGGYGLESNGTSTPTFLNSLSGVTQGNVISGVSTTNSGGSHGGLGGIVSVQPPAAYDSFRSPVLPGGGGSSGGPLASANGGGVVHLKTSSSLLINGLINANSNIVSPAGYPTSGGAGGSIWLDAARVGLGDSASVEANGSEGILSGSGGGGGRIAIYYSVSDAVDLSGIWSKLSAIGGAGATTNQYGNAGSLYLYKYNANQYGNLRFDNHGMLGFDSNNRSPLNPASTNDIRLDSLEILGGAQVKQEAVGTTPNQRGAYILILGSFNLDSESKFFVPEHTTGSQDFGDWFQASTTVNDLPIAY